LLGPNAETYSRFPGELPMALGSDASRDANSIRVFTVDDQEIFRGVARDVIAATPGFKSVGEAASGEAALEAIERLSPQLVLCDVRMPGIDGVEVARRLTATHPETVVVLVSIEERDDVAAAARLEGIPLFRKQDFGPRLLRRIWDRQSNNLVRPAGHTDSEPEPHRRVGSDPRGP